MSRPTLLVDFDGTLHDAPPGFTAHLGPPKQHARRAMFILARRHRLICFTARADLERVQSWLKANGFPHMLVTNIKQSGWIIDDHALGFPGEWSDELINAINNITHSRRLSQMQEGMGDNPTQQADDSDGATPPGDLTLDGPEA